MHCIPYCTPLYWTVYCVLYWALLYTCTVMGCTVHCVRGCTVCFVRGCTVCCVLGCVVYCVRGCTVLYGAAGPSWWGCGRIEKGGPRTSCPPLRPRGTGATAETGERTSADPWCGRGAPLACQSTQALTPTPPVMAVAPLRRAKMRRPWPPVVWTRSSWGAPTAVGGGTRVWIGVCSGCCRAVPLCGWRFTSALH